MHVRVQRLLGRQNMLRFWHGVYDVATRASAWMCVQLATALTHSDELAVEVDRAGQILLNGLWGRHHAQCV